MTTQHSNSTRSNCCVGSSSCISFWTRRLINYHIAHRRYPYIDDWYLHWKEGHLKPCRSQYFLHLTCADTVSRWAENMSDAPIFRSTNNTLYEVLSLL